MNKQTLRTVLIWIAIVAFMIGSRYVLPLLLISVVGYGVYRLIVRLNEAQGSKRPFFDFSASSTSNKPSSSPMATLMKLRPKHIACGIIALVVLFIIIDGLVSVPAGHVAVIYDRGRGVLDKEMTEGLHVKIPFWQIATIMDTRLQAFTMSDKERAQSRDASESIQALTKDGQRVDLDVTVQFRIPADAASHIVQTIGLDYNDKVIQPGARSVSRSIITGFESTELFSEESRLAAATRMREQLAVQYAQSDIQLIDLLLRNVQFSEVYLKAIEDKQVAQQRIQRAEFEKQEAEKVKERKIIEAQAEAESIRLKGETLRANPNVIQFEFVQKLAPNIQWGVLHDSALPLLDLRNLQR